MIGLGMQGASMFQSMGAAKKQKAAAAQMAALNMQANEIYGKQAKLEYKRRSWEIFREQQRARSEALATTTNQGAAAKGSSALGGAYGQIGGQVGGELLKNDQNFQLYKQLQEVYDQMAMVAGSSGQSSQAMGTSFAAFAGQLAKVLPAFGQLGLLGSQQ